jgi:hypothetical protein
VGCPDDESVLPHEVVAEFHYSSHRIFKHLDHDLAESQRNFERVYFALHYLIYLLLCTLRSTLCNIHSYFQTIKREGFQAFKPVDSCERGCGR